MENGGHLSRPQCVKSLRWISARWEAISELCQHITWNNTPGSILLTWFYYDPSITCLIECVMKLLFHYQLQLLLRWSLGMDEKFHLPLYNGCSYLSMLGFNLFHFSKRSPWENPQEFALVSNFCQQDSHSITETDGKDTGLTTLDIENMFTCSPNIKLFSYFI